MAGMSSYCSSNKISGIHAYFQDSDQTLPAVYVIAIMYNCCSVKNCFYRKGTFSLIKSSCVQWITVVRKCGEEFSFFPLDCLYIYGLLFKFLHYKSVRFHSLSIHIASNDITCYYPPVDH